ncbi:nuclear transport factor 2 family protein [Nocardia cyriacigeorgica]|uniref:Limonene-1,2-epoxide hydrolase n=1 Tax=Nocardia cyriacigeorgica TaxID=135487 RepID=A0A4U8VZ18_9NOCA|nr:nuclear transport factor 2 family protein [Nocardia cyriacigeorgica]MBF6098707.1 nuclear transport factor 2 family protein [Nocardia cyriacigeorgica]MBF6162461.1 nuclear transport factor 2 family protein [Nocardia cyriacigeorgica]MBF6201420.1 nuclear transport factor 2 family protein [Nocardia cyriacigeorgica]VFA97759.1 Limonene-1,2-epoxide hydrolase [Nocardia cyriacigeorgica]
MTTDWDAVHARVVETFIAGWDDLDSRAHDAFLAEDVELVQPLIPTCTSKRQWWAEVERLRGLLPGLRSDVQSWAGAEDVLFIEHRLGATVGQRTVEVDATDRFHLTAEGIVTRRIAYFDPAPLIRAVATSPSTWPKWWRHRTFATRSARTA